MTDEPEVIDGQLVPDESAPDEPTAAPASPTTALTIVDGSAGAIIRADEPTEILRKAHAIAKPLADLIESAGLAVNVGGRQKHVVVGGWQATGALLGALGGQPLHAETVWTRMVNDPETGRPKRTTYTAEVKHFQWVNGKREHKSTTTYEVDGFDWEACVEIKTPSGVVVGRAEAMVSRAEESWNRSADYAVRSMAETRAESRAWRKATGWIVHLAGYNPTPAEEMGHTPGADTEPAALAPPAIIAANEKQDVADALRELVGADGSPEDTATLKNLWLALCDGQPRPTVTAAKAIVETHAAMAMVRERQGQPT